MSSGNIGKVSGNIGKIENTKILDMYDPFLPVSSVGILVEFYRYADIDLSLPIISADILALTNIYP